MENNNINVIEIKWEGPYNFESIKEKKEKDGYDEKLSMDYGLYQMYGNHYMYGSDTLLYIGKANQKTFRGRLSQHEGWLAKEASDVSIYLGRLGGIQKPLNLYGQESFNKYWEKCIDDAEKLLIHFCSPPYNSSNIGNYELNISDTIVLNFGKRNKLPAEFSTLYNGSKYWPENNENKNEWKYFEWKNDDKIKIKENEF